MKWGVWRSLAGVLAAASALALSAGTSSAGAEGIPAQITAASLRQRGQDLVWNVRLSHAFSPESLRRADASLCLLFERAANGALRTEVCFEPGAHRRPPPRLSGTDGKPIVANVSRADSEDLIASFLPSAIGLRYGKLRWQTQLSVSAPACAVAPTQRPNPCTELSPARPRLLALHTPRLVGCVPHGSTRVFGGSSKVHDIALTFDDGPWYDTPTFLRLLEREHVPATFFEIGDQIAEYGHGGAIERRMLRDGDMIGDHTWSHPDVAGDGSFARSEIVRAADAIRSATHGFTPCLFRAPYGATSRALLSEVRSLGMTTIQWDIDPRDWALPGVGEIESNVISNARNGGIVIMHDGGGNRSETIAALPTIIGALRRRGYKFVTITQMLGYRLIYK